MLVKETEKDITSRHKNLENKKLLLIRLLMKLTRCAIYFQLSYEYCIKIIILSQKKTTNLIWKLKIGRTEKLKKLRGLSQKIR